MGGGHANWRKGEQAWKAAVAHSRLMAPMYTQHLQPVGTPAKKASWGDGQEVWPLWDAVTKHVQGLVKGNDAKGMEAIDKWFASRYTNNAARSAGIPADEVAKLVAKPASEAPSKDPPVKAAAADEPPRPKEPGKA